MFTVIVLLPIRASVRCQCPIERNDFQSAVHGLPSRHEFGPQARWDAITREDVNDLSHDGSAHVGLNAPPVDRVQEGDARLGLLRRYVAHIWSDDGDENVRVEYGAVRF